MKDVKRGEIWYIDKGYSTGSEQHSGRPAVIVSNDMNNRFCETVEVVYLTTKPKTDLPTHVVIESTNRRSTVLCEQVTTVSVDRLGTFYGAVSPDEMDAIAAALAISLDLPAAAPEPAPAVEENTAEPVEDPCIAGLAEQCARADIEYRILESKYNALLNMVVATAQ